MPGWQPVMTVVVAVCLLVVGCGKQWTWEDAMQALKDDPMASASWDGLELVGVVETVEDSHKPPPPSVTRCYILGIPPEEAFERVRKTAEHYGWVEEVEVRSPDHVKFTKIINGSDVTLRLSSDSYRCKLEYENKGIDIDFGIALSDR